MKKNASIRDVALHAGVAASTVSRVLGDGDWTRHASDETRQRILASARALNYSPNINAKRLFSKKSEVLALVLPSHEKHGKHVLGDFHLSGVFSGIESALSETNYRLLVVFNDDRFIHEKEYLKLYRQRAIDGMMVWGAYEGQRFWSELPRNRHPMLFITRPPIPLDGFNYVIHDYTAAGRDVLSGLLRLGHRAFAWVGAVEHNGITLDIEAGFRDAARACPECKLVGKYGQFRESCGFDLTRKALAEHPDVDVVLAGNVDVARGALRALDERPSGAPPVKVIACDSAEKLERSDLPRVSVDDFALGVHATQALLELVENRDWSCQERLPAHWIPGVAESERS